MVKHRSLLLSEQPRSKDLDLHAEKNLPKNHFLIIVVHSTHPNYCVDVCFRLDLLACIPLLLGSNSTVILDINTKGRRLNTLL